MQPTPFTADLPDLVGDPPPAPEGLRAALLQRDLDRALHSNALLRETLVDLSADLAHRPDLQSRIRAALLRSL